jgi:dihydrofolate reductase
MIASIWAQTAARVIGQGGKIPWRYSGDFKRFKRLTMGDAIILGRITYESIGKGLPGRANIVVTSQRIAVSASASGGEATSVGTARSVELAIASAASSRPGRDVWFIGGARVYAEAMAHVDMLDVTLVPDVVPDAPDVVKAPEIDTSLWRVAAECAHPDEPRLWIQRWLKKDETRTFRSFP